MSWTENIALAVCTLIIVTAAVIFFAAKPAPCNERGCYGGMCNTSAACVPGCACIANRCS